MRNKIKNKYLFLGLLFNGVWLFSKHIFSLPEFINGLLAGLAITLMLFGAYAENHDVSKIKNFKRNLFKRFLKSSI